MLTRSETLLWLALIRLTNAAAQLPYGSGETRGVLVLRTHLNERRNQGIPMMYPGPLEKRDEVSVNVRYVFKSLAVVVSVRYSRQSQTQYRVHRVDQGRYPSHWSCRTGTLSSYQDQ